MCHSWWNYVFTRNTTHFWNIIFYYVQDHRRTVAQHCINGDRLSQWRRAKFDPHRMETPEPIAKKLGTVDYVQEATPMLKFCANPSTGGFPANAWNIIKFFNIYILLLEIHLQVRPLHRFSRAMSQTMQSHAWVCLLGVKNLILMFNP